jgi:transposase
MPAPYSLDLRHKAILAYENGEGTQQEIAERFLISVATFHGWLVLRRETGDVKPKEYIYRGRMSIIDGERIFFIKELIEIKPDILISEIRRVYKKRFKVGVSQSMVSRAFKKLNLHRKKKSLYAQEQGREDVKKKRELERRDNANGCQ